MGQPKIKTNIEARVKDTGDTMTGDLILNYGTYPRIALNSEDNNSCTFVEGSANKISLQTSQMSFGNSGDNRRIFNLSNKEYSENVKDCLYLSDRIDGVTTNYLIYGEHNKPTPTELEAITYGTQREEIPANADLNNYLTIGVFKCPTSATVKTLLNCPTTEAFIMDIISGTGNNNKINVNNYTYIVQKLMTYHGEIYIRKIQTNPNNTDNQIIYDNWKHFIHSENVGNYALPISGGILTGQLKANKNISIINTNPWILLNDTDVGYDFYIQASGSLLGLGRGWENSLLINTAGQITLQTKTSIADNTPAGIFFHITQTDNSITTKSAFIKVYDDHDAYTHGTNMVIQSAGNMIIGSGEAPMSAYNTDLKNSTAESTYIVSDNSIYFYTNCNSYSSKKTSCYINTSGVLYGAAWNDYAEYRESVVPVQAGRCVKELGNGKLQQTQSRLEPGCLIVSDTFGYAIGQTEICQTPIAVSGRVLAYPAEDRNSYNPGDAVCSGPNGTVSKMTRKEIMFYPERIIGTVSEIPEYETWGEGNVPVDNRIWISIK